jgi:hypothetical protein
VESSYLSKAFGSSNYLFKSLEELKCKPRVTHHGPNQVEQDLIKKGRDLCTPHEEELTRLESIIRPYVSVSKLSKCEADSFS